MSMPLPRRIPPNLAGKTVVVYWHADSWLPLEYKRPGFTIQAMRYALSKYGLLCPRITACVDLTFPDELVERYSHFGVFPVYFSDDERQTLMDMLASLAGQARVRVGCPFVVVAKLSQHTQMMSRVLGSLIHRGVDIVLVVPEVDEPNNFGIYREEPEPEPGSISLPVWVCPSLFDEALPIFPKTAGDREALEIERERRMEAGQQEEDEDEDEKFFMQLPAPQITTFSMAPNVTTCVFWDVKDYPVPQGLDPGKFFENIKSATCSSGDLSIYAYGAAEDLDSLPPSYLDAGITFVKTPAYKVSRATVMLVDIVLWSMDNPWRPPSVSKILVISKDEIKSSCMFGAILGGMRHYKVFLALPDDFPPPLGFEKSVLRWETLSARGKKAEDQRGGGHCFCCS